MIEVKNKEYKFSMVTQINKAIMPKNQSTEPMVFDENRNLCKKVTWYCI
jgi:hypothetical protein